VLLRNPSPWSMRVPVLALSAIVMCVSSADAARALLVGVAESYEGYANANSGTEDYRGLTRYDRLVEAIAGWNDANVDFGVLLGDNLANSEDGWPLLLDAIENSEIPIYLALGNHDWINQEQDDATPHPDSCFNLKPEEQIPGCPNTLYFLDYLQNNFGLSRPWYAFVEGGVIFVILADELFDPRGYLSGGVSDVHDEQFYWFRDIVAANLDQPIVVFAHHPVFDTVAGSDSLISPLNRLGWRPRVGEVEGDTVSVTQDNILVTRASGDFDPKLVTVGSEFQVQGESDWYRIASIAGNVLTLTTPYGGPTEPAVSFGAGGHFNELTNIIKDPNNSIRVIMSGHTGEDFQFTWNGLSQLEFINGKTFAFAGSLAPKDMRRYPICSFIVGSDTASFDHTSDSSRIVPGSLIGPAFTEYVEILDVSWSPILGGPASVNLASAPDITEDYVGQVCLTKRTEPFSETRLLLINETNPADITVADFNYATGWLGGNLFPGDFDDPRFPDPLLVTASFELDGATLRLTPTDSYGAALYGSDGQADYTFEVELKRISGGGGGIIFRAQDEDSFYFFELDEVTQTFKLGQSSDGDFLTLAEVQPGVSLKDEYTLSVEVRGSLIRTFVDGTPAIIFTQAVPTGFLDDTFDTDPGDWTAVNDEGCAIAGSTLTLSNKGVCMYTGTGKGAQVTERDQWVSVIHESVLPFSGPAVRHKGADQSTSEYHYVSRFRVTDGSVIPHFRVCNGSDDDGNCSTFLEGSDVGSASPLAVGDASTFAVAGEGTDTVFAWWFHRAASLPTDLCDPEDGGWGAADYCIYDGVAPIGTDIESHCECSTTTTCAAWDTDPGTITDFGYPAAAQTDVALYNGHTTAAEYDRLCGGSLGPDFLTFRTGRYGLFSRTPTGSDFEDVNAFGGITPLTAPEPGLAQMLVAGIVGLTLIHQYRDRIRRL